MRSGVVVRLGSAIWRTALSESRAAMLFNSFDFLLFFVCVFMLQLVLPYRPRNIFLLAASYFFYGCWDWRYLSLVLGSTTVNYLCGMAIEGTSSVRRKKAFVAASIAFNLSLLGFFKYAGFFVDSLDRLLLSSGIPVSDLHLDIVLPVGISFFTFQGMGYTIDVYRKDIRAERNPIDFALFIAFFPQLLAGPIGRARNLLPQMITPRPFSFSAFKEGCWLIFWGLFKKAVIANNMAPIVANAFGASHVPGGDLVIALYAFALQIYADFSGYSDIARGTAKMMGYELMLNFRMPYLAANPREFWQRWHISLSTWLRDYLYIPLGGNRKGTSRTYVNLLLTMLIGGFWHGAAWTFVLWGAYHGFLLVAHRILSGRALSPTPSTKAVQAAWRVVGIVVMFHLVCFGWLIFRSPSIGQFGSMTSSLFTDFRFTMTSAQWGWQILLFCWPLFIVQILQELSGETEVVLKLSTASRSLVYATLAVMMLALGDFGGREFIYFQF